MFSEVAATLPVKNMEEAKKYYGETLGLSEAGENPGGTYYKVGSSRIYVYPSEFAGTNKATAAGFTSSDVEGTVEALKAKGVTFEHYEDMPGATVEGDVHVMGTDKVAWTVDPSGNILAIGNS